MTNINFGIISEKRLRERMEDVGELIIKPEIDWVFGGVYDGHGGDQVALLAKEKMFDYFCHFLQEDGDVSKAFQKSYISISLESRENLIGAAAANFFINANKIYTANAGDCRIIITGEKPKQLTVDHRVNNSEEAIRIMMGGGKIDNGYVWCGNEGIEATRALGDLYFHHAGLISIPETNQHVISNRDNFLICGSDGLYDALSNTEINELSKGITKAQELADILLKNAVKSDDNITIIVVNLKSIMEHPVLQERRGLFFL